MDVTAGRFLLETRWRDLREPVRSSDSRGYLSSKSCCRRCRRLPRPSAVLSWNRTFPDAHCTGIEPDGLFLCPYQFAEAALGTKPDFPSVDFELLVLRLTSVSLHGRRLVSYLFHLIDALCFRESSTSGVIADERRQAIGCCRMVRLQCWSHCRDQYRTARRGRSRGGGGSPSAGWPIHSLSSWRDEGAKRLPRCAILSTTRYPRLMGGSARNAAEGEQAGQGALKPPLSACIIRAMIDRHQ